MWSCVISVHFHATLIINKSSSSSSSSSYYLGLVHMLVHCCLTEGHLVYNTCEVPVCSNSLVILSTAGNYEISHSYASDRCQILL